MTEPTESLFGMSPGNPVELEHLLRRPVGNGLWIFKAAHEPLRAEPLHFDRHLTVGTPTRLRGQVNLHDGNPATMAIFQKAIESTFNDIQAISRTGTLSLRDTGRGRAHGASNDVICAGRTVARTWKGGIVSVIVRRLPVGAGVTLGDRPANVVMTVVPKSNSKWRSILRGEPLPTGCATYEIASGECFTLDEHCVWFKQPVSEVFRP